MIFYFIISVLYTYIYNLAKIIQPLCFGHCNNLTIKYLGTIKQFKRLLSRDVFYEANAQIICSNGTLEISNKSFY